MTGALESRAGRVLIPVLTGLAALLFWEWSVAAAGVSRLILPAPSDIGAALAADLPSLLGSLWTTLRVTLVAFALAAVSGMALAFLFAQSRTVELALSPYAVVLQVTPLVSIAPLVIVWVGINNAERAIVILAWIAAFFPVLSNMTTGLKSADRNLRDLFALYGASAWDTFWRLRFPAALPYLLPALKISAGLALVGAVVAEFVAGSGGTTGLAWRIVEAGNRLQVPKMFAALLLLAALGVALYFAIALLERALLRRWHESAA